jgi:signal transduction histidine kinase
MEWQVILALIFAVTIIMFPAVFIWYLNIGGIYAALRERGGIRVPAIIRRATRVTLVVLLPVAVYAVAIWFFYGHFGWQVAVAVAIFFPVVLFVPALIWAAVIRGLYQVALDRLRRRVAVPRRKMSAEPVVEVVTKGE